MLLYPNIDPIAIHLGPLKIHWYGLMYLFGFLGAWTLLNFRIKKNRVSFTQEQLSDILFYSALGIILGGRMGYMFFYAWPQLVASPLSLFKIWQGGMSFHGGLMGVIIALTFYARKLKVSVFTLTDFIAPVVPIGLGLGRIGNFINGELWGKPTEVSWGMIFPYAGPLARHPSQLYEFMLEGVMLFLILWTFSSRQRPRFATSGLFLILYGLFRFILEFFREPDIQIGYIALGWLTQGQLLSLPMIMIGAALLIYAYQRKLPCDNI